jgi:hypothetical protein
LGNFAQAKENYINVLNLWRNGDDSPLRRVVAREAKEMSLQVGN